MTKYHISQTTGKPNICRAKPGQCPLTDEEGYSTPHYESKEEAQSAIEKSLNNKYNKNSSVKKNVERDLNTLKEVYEKTKNQSFRSIDIYLADNLPEFKESRTIAQIDYMNQVLLEKDGNHYVMGFYGGDWLDYEPMYVRAVKKQKKKQVEVEQTFIEGDRYKDPEMLESLQEYDNFLRNTNKYSFGIIYEADETSDRTSISATSRQKPMIREDGSKVIMFSVKPEGDTSIDDEPYPIDVDLDLYESEERQNARTMERAVVFYDDRLDRGIILKYSAASDGYSGSYLFDIEQDGTITLDGEDSTGQAMYSIKGTGKMKDAEYWKEV